MTAEQYWDEDCLSVKYYREAEEIRKERMNQELWLQGRYVYDAISCLSPVLHAFAKKGTKAKSYLDEPYPITKQTQKEEVAKKEKANSQKGLRYMQQLMAQSEIYFEGKERK